MKNKMIIAPQQDYPNYYNEDTITSKTTHANDYFLQTDFKQ